MKRFIFVLFVLISVFSVYAQSGFIIHKSNGEADTIKNDISPTLRLSTWNDDKNESMGDVIVWLKSGEKITATLCSTYFVESDHLSITCDENVMKIAVSDVEKFTFDIKAETGIKSIDVDKTQIIKNGNKIILSNLMPNSAVILFNVEGKLIRKFISDFQGRLVFELNNITSGIYSISTQKSTFKVMIK